MEKSILTKLADVAEKAVKEYCDSKGLNYEVAYTRGSYGSTYGKFTIEVAQVANGEVLDRDAAVLKRNAGRLAEEFNLPGLQYGTRFIANDGYYRLTGYNSRSRKYPFIAVNEVNGKAYKFSGEYLNFIWNKGNVMGAAT